LIDYPKVAQPTFAKFGGKVAHGNKRLDFGGDPDPDLDPGIFLTEILPL